MIDDMYIKDFTEKVEKLKSTTEKFISVYNSDLKILLLKRENPRKLIELGDGAWVIKEKMKSWKKVYY